MNEFERMMREQLELRREIIFGPRYRGNFLCELSSCDGGIVGHSLGKSLLTALRGAVRMADKQRKDKV